MTKKWQIARLEQLERSVRILFRFVVNSEASSFHTVWSIADNNRSK